MDTEIHLRLADTDANVLGGSEGEIVTIRNACITAHTKTLDANNAQEETVEFYSYVQPVLTSGLTDFKHCCDCPCRYLMNRGETNERRRKCMDNRRASGTNRPSANWCTVKYRGKEFHFQFCELTEQEEPQLKALADNATAQEKQDWATETGTERILAMIEKANKKNPDGITLTSENWSSVPVTLRYQITSDVLSFQQEITENFITG